MGRQDKLIGRQDEIKKTVELVFSAVMMALLWSIVYKEQSIKATVLIFWVVYILTLSCGH